jgi:hypothetical protein
MCEGLCPDADLFTTSGDVRHEMPFFSTNSRTDLYRLPTLPCLKLDKTAEEDCSHLLS